MTEHDGITGDIRSREEEYFRRKDRELVERMRQEAAERQAREELEARSGIQDPALLQELEELGFTPDTVSLLPLVPIVQVAWAEGGVSAEERRLIEQFAGQRGIQPDSPAGRKLATWLENEPSPDVFARATRLIRAILDTHGSASTDLKVEDLLQHCEVIAAASGGILGFRKISAEERSLLQEIESTLKSK